ncbi:hypothetical protein [Streptomyces sp. JHA26]|uniref:hypothetical protein n=1 Tax=Streptomyces sp. JHA26 TaxID=1917143 RepID=UPI00209ADD33|nr:hypothetical protein [Streptomyces sp. JHA26]
MRAQGRYGPELRDVLPAFTGLGLVVAGLAVALARLYRALGVGGLLLGVILLAAATAVGWRWRRVAVRRRGGIYTPAELTTLDEHGLAVAAERMLRRDGWHVIPMPDAGRPRLYARDRDGRRLDVRFRPADRATADRDTSAGPAPTLREPGRPGADNPIRVIVSRDPYSRTDALRASRQGGVHLVDGRRLHRWAAGTSLDDLGLRAVST